MKTAVIAIDLSSSDRNLLSYVKDNKEILGLTTLHFVHVLPEKFDQYPSAEEMWGPINQEAKEEIMANIQKEVGKYFKLKKGEVEFHLLKGDPLSELVDHAESNKADLVVIGQKSSVKKHGVLARNFVRNVSCNGLVIPEDRPDTIQNILVPVDFSPHSAKSLKEAAALVDKIGKETKVTAIHIFEMPALGYYKLSMTERKFRNSIMSNIEDGLKNFIRAQAPSLIDRIKIKAVSRGVPGVSSYLTEYAIESNADFIIMGAKGHSKIKLLLMGSVTEGLLSGNKFLPTLIVK